jgi:hypothetical protein
MFDIAPNAWSMFPWGKGDYHKDEFFTDPQFQKFAKNFVSMLDLAIGMITVPSGCNCSIAL